MASKQAMLPWLGHSVVVMTNTNESVLHFFVCSHFFCLLTLSVFPHLFFVFIIRSPARFAIVLQLLDFMTGHAPPTPSWTATYLAALAAQVNATRDADAAARARYAAARARPGGNVAPSDGALLGWYAHPAYGNCSIGVAVDGAVDGVAAPLQIGHCATLLPGTNAAPSLAANASLTHLYFSTFGLDVPGANFAMATASTQLIRFFATEDDGVFDRFETPSLEGAVPPIVFTKWGGAYRGQAVGWSPPGVASRAYDGAAASYAWPLPRPRVEL
jgi:hypothetical protein